MKEDIYYFAPPGEPSPFYFSIVGVSYCDGSYKISRPPQELTVLEYVHKGCGTIVVDGKEYTARAGDVYIIHANTRHYYASSAGDPWVKSFFNMHGPLCESLLKAYGLGQTTVIPAFDRPELFWQMHRNVVQAHRAKNTNIFQNAAVELHRLIQAFGAFCQKNSRQNAPDAEFRPVLEYLAQNTRTIITNKQLANLIFRSEDYLVKGFRRFYGVTPYNYQLNLKIEAARQLLRQTKLPVSAVGEMVGYGDAMYFSNIFKKKCGISPLKYRKQNQ